jgi:hypothetical protein
LFRFFHPSSKRFSGCGVADGMGVFVGEGVADGWIVAVLDGFTGSCPVSGSDPIPKGVCVLVGKPGIRVGVGSTAAISWRTCNVGRSLSPVQLATKTNTPAIPRINSASLSFRGKRNLLYNSGYANLDRMVLLLF